MPALAASPSGLIAAGQHAEKEWTTGRRNLTRGGTPKREPDLHLARRVLMLCHVVRDHGPTCDHHGKAKIYPAANGVAIFACWGAGEFFEAIQLTTPVSDNRVYACPQPHLYHLARLDEQYPRYADELLISGALEDCHPLPEEVRAILAPELPDSEGGTASEEPRQASLPDLLMTKAKQSGATVTFIEDAALLESVGGVGAFLRWCE